MRYAWIQQHRDSFPISLMCQVLQVSTSGYYDAPDNNGYSMLNLLEDGTIRVTGFRNQATYQWK